MLFLGGTTTILHTFQLLVLFISYTLERPSYYIQLMDIFYIVRVGVSPTMHYVGRVGFSIIVYISMLLCVLVICVRVTKCVYYVICV